MSRSRIPLLAALAVAPSLFAAARGLRRSLGAGNRPLDYSGSPQFTDGLFHNRLPATQAPEGHSNVFLAGNDRTGLWKKLLGLAPPAEIGDAVARVLDDPAECEAPSPPSCSRRSPPPPARRRRRPPNAAGAHCSCAGRTRPAGPCRPR